MQTEETVLSPIIKLTIKTSKFEFFRTVTSNDIPSELKKKPTLINLINRDTSSSPE